MEPGKIKFLKTYKNKRFIAIFLENYTLFIILKFDENKNGL